MSRILVIDDNLADQELFAIAHERSGAEGEVVRWPHADDAITWLRQQAPGADVVVVDLNMPRVHGIKLIALLRAELSAPPSIVALSGSTNPRDREAALAAGADLYLVKPDGFDAWLEVIAGIRALG
jgi:CheY-like chemotaxis protein